MRKIALITLFPIIAFIWTIGWVLYYTGIQQNETKPAKTQTKKKKDNLEILAILDQEQLTIKN